MVAPVLEKAFSAARPWACATVRVTDAPGLRVSPVAMACAAPDSADRLATVSTMVNVAPPVREKFGRAARASAVAALTVALAFNTSPLARRVSSVFNVARCSAVSATVKVWPCREKRVPSSVRPSRVATSTVSDATKARVPVLASMSLLSPSRDAAVPSMVRTWPPVLKSGLPNSSVAWLAEAVASPDSVRTEASAIPAALPPLSRLAGVSATVRTLSPISAPMAARWLACAAVRVASPIRSISVGTAPALTV